MKVIATGVPRRLMARRLRDEKCDADRRAHFRARHLRKEKMQRCAAVRLSSRYRGRRHVLGLSLDKVVAPKSHKREKLTIMMPSEKKNNRQEGQRNMIIPMTELLAVRNQFNIRGADIARSMEMNDSTFSRFQQRENAEEQDARRYLDGCGFDQIDEFIAFHGSPWELVEITPLSWLHPDREPLQQILRGVQRLDAFSRSGKCDELLAPVVARLRKRLLRAAKLLSNRDHTLAFMGEPGRYKTTTICRMAGLWREGRPRLPVGSGLTTVCEMIIRSGVQAAVDVIPHEDVDVQAWVRNWIQGKTTDGLAVTPEIDRALRSMSGLTVRRQRGPDGKPVRGPDGKPLTEDPVEQLKVQFGGPDQLAEEVMRLINLPGRRTRSLTCPEGEDGLTWLEGVVANVNSGKQEDVSLPKSITITLPVAFGADLPFRLTAVDTKGIDGTTQREDLMTYLESVRTVSVLCSLFPAVDGSLLRLLRQEQDARLRAVEDDRVILLMLAKGKEAEEVLDDSGMRAGSVEDGYIIKEGQVRQVLRNEGLSDIPLVFFNAYEEEPAEVWTGVSKGLRVLRDRWVKAAIADLSFVDRLERETDLVRVEEGFSKMATRLVGLVKEVAKLPTSNRHPKQNLLEEMDRVHASVLAASMRRQGRYVTFSVPYVLATGIRIIANARSKKPIDQIKSTLEELATQFDDVDTVRTAVGQLREEIDESRHEFLRQVQDFANRHLASYFEEEAAPVRWDRIGGEWGRGAGYRGRVRTRFDEWFEDEELDAQVQAIEAQILELWHRSVVQRLKTAHAEARAGTHESAAG
jgi:hypothetical protein